MQEEKEKSNKKVLILSILGVLVLIIAVVGVSYAMYTFSANGSKENVITTGIVKINFDNSDLNFDGVEGDDASGTIDLTNQYPMTDTVGLAQTGTEDVLGFTISAELSGKIKIVYDLGVEVVSSGKTLTEDYIKLALYEYQSNQPVLITQTPRTIKELKDSAGVNGCMDSYVLTNGEFTGTGGSTEQKKNYIVKAWVADTYKLPTVPETGTTDTENQPTDGDVTHESHTESEEFKFKIKLVAEQAAE